MKSWLIAATLLLTSLSSFAMELNADSLKNYLKAAPEVASWVNKQDVEGLNLGSLLGASSMLSGDTSAMANGALGMLKGNGLYKQFAGLVGQYGFTPEQLIAVGSQVSQAYLANTTGLSGETKKLADKSLNALKAVSNNEEKDVSSLLGKVGKLGKKDDAQDKQESVINAQNVELVKQYMPQVKQVLSLLGK